MANNTKQQTREEYEDWVDEDTQLAEDFTDKLNKLFYRMLKNPSDKEMDNFQTVRDALIIAFLIDLMDRLKIQLKNSMQTGIAVANQQLKRLNVDKIVKKTINDKKFKDMLDSVIKSNEVTLAYVLDGIKVNTDNIIKDIKSNVIDTKKVISAELASEFAKNGISEFQDRAGRRISINNYIKQKSLDEITKIMRNSYFMQAVKYGVPYVRIIHLNLHPTCPLCSPFEGKVLALEENDKGVMTLAEASEYSLFHVNCDHVPMAMELTNDFSEDEIKINLTEENKKRKAYNKKRGFKSFFG
jgi:hypothetical protein